jgi:flagellar biosynthesis/type III secretory pathway protein FliH
MNLVLEGGGRLTADRKESFQAGWRVGYNQGYGEGFEAGCEAGFKEGKIFGYHEGYAEGLCLEQDFAATVRRLKELLLQDQNRLADFPPEVPKLLAKLYDVVLKPDCNR